MRRLRSAIFLGLICASLLTPMRAKAEGCWVEGTSSGFYVRKFDLPNGSNYLALGLGGRLAIQPLVSENTWHRAEGIFLINASTGALWSWMIVDNGSSVPRLVVQSNGTTVSQVIPAPMGPYGDPYYYVVGGIDPGTWYAVGFGITSGPHGLIGDEYWRVMAQAFTGCGDPVDVPGETFEFNQTDFTGGTQLYTPVAGYARGISMNFQTSRRRVIGFLNAEANSPGTADLKVVTGSQTKTVTHSIQPMSFPGGSFRFTADYQGDYPRIGIAGVALDL